MALLELRDLTIDFDLEGGQLRAVDGVSLAVDSGQALGIVGESGSGKTVTALAIMGLLPPSACITGGEVRFSGEDLATKTAKEMESIRGRRIGMVFQEPMTSLNPAYAVGEQVAEVLRHHFQMGAAEAKRRAIDLFERVKLPRAREIYDKYPHEFSGGMRQRVMIAAAIAGQPSALIADEPTTALDVTIQAQILFMLQELQREMGLALIFISHDLEVVSQMCDRVAVMYGARLMEQGETSTLFAAPRHPYTRGLLDSIPRRGQPLRPIPGAIFDLRDPPRGCRFHPRCPHAQERCEDQEPALQMALDTGNGAAGKSRSFACHFPLVAAGR